MPAPYLGTCLCGQVQFRLAAEPLTYYACHCTDCQRRTGGGMRLVMWVERAALEVLAGQTALLIFDLHSGRKRKSRACPNCDTRLWGEPQDRPSLATLLPGTLQNFRDFAPVAHIWTASAPQWVQIPPDVASYATQPDDPTELIRLWQTAVEARRRSMRLNPSFQPTASGGG
jgi:hypothetical protein